MKIHKRAVFFTPLVTLCLLTGCATSRDIAYLDSRIEDQHRTVRELDQKVGDLGKRVGKLDKGVESVAGKVSPVSQKDRADINTAIEDLQKEVKILRANVEEDREFINRVANELQVLKRDYDAKISAYQKAKETPPPPITLPKEQPAPIEEDMEGSYQRAYQTFKKGDYRSALTMFKEFLRKYQQSEYADNAQYWIGECYYQQKDYEAAILEYEKVIKRYPQADKVPSALLKQGFAFLSLGDRVDAKILFKKVIKDYPRSPQADVASKKLKSLD